MSNWENKSALNLKAASVLIENSFHNESVHCSYYSCIQFAFHVMNEGLGMTVEDIKLKSTSGTSSHKWIAKEIFQSLRALGATEAVDFNNDMLQLKLKRVKADYDLNSIAPKEAGKAQKKAVKIISLLKRIYL